MQAIKTKSEYILLGMPMSANRSSTNSYQTSLKRKHPSKVTAWKEIQNCHTSSSVFGEVCRGRDETSLTSTCKCLMGYTNVSLSLLQLKSDKQSELKARDAYLCKQDAVLGTQENRMSTLCPYFNACTSIF